MGGQNPEVGADGRAYLRSGYAVLSVSARGTGCSQGSFEVLAEPVQAGGAAQVIEWAGIQPWSDGNAG